VERGGALDLDRYLRSFMIYVITTDELHALESEGGLC